MAKIKPLSGPQVWHGRDLAGSRRWIRDLSARQLSEIDAALTGTKAKGIPWEGIRRENFPLPSLAPLVDDVREELENGCGLVKIRGLAVDRYEPDDLRRIYFALGHYLGTPIFQNYKGMLMREIRDEGADVGTRYGQMADTNGTFLSSLARTATNGALRFHTDRCDVVSLLCVSRASKGGESKLVSTVAIHDAMLECRPDLLELLYQPYWRSRLGEEVGGDQLTYALPVFAVRNGRFTSHYSRTYVEAAQRLPHVPRMTPQQNEALDLLAAIAEELCFKMTLEPGDLQLLNNHIVYHARAPFEDDPASGRRRALWRIWLSMPNSRALPEDHAILWGSVEAGAIRGGIAQAASAPSAGPAPA